MANNISKLAHYNLDSSYNDIAMLMIHDLQPNFTQSPTSFSNWMQLMLNYTQKHYEVIIVGNNAPDLMKELDRYYIPNITKAMSTTTSDLPIFKGRYSDKQTRIFVCTNNTCKTPVATVNEAIKLITYKLN